jgi:hypothetical protein
MQNGALSCGVMAYYSRFKSVTQTIYFTGNPVNNKWSWYRYNIGTGTITKSSWVLDCLGNDMHNMVTGTTETISQGQITLHERVWVADGRQVIGWGYSTTPTVVVPPPVGCQVEQCWIFGIAHDGGNNALYYSQGYEIKKCDEDGSDVTTVYSRIIDAGQFNRILVIYSLVLAGDYIFVAGYHDNTDLSNRCLYRIPKNPTTLGNPITINQVDDRFIICWGGGSAQFAVKPGDSLYHFA